MKLIRFFRNLFFYIYEEFALPALAAVIVMAVGYALAYVIGWVAIYFGMEHPKSESGVFDSTSALGAILMIATAIVFLIGVWIYRFFNWLKDMWRDS